MKTLIKDDEPQRDPYEGYRVEYKRNMTNVVSVLRKSIKFTGRN